MNIIASANNELKKGNLDNALALYKRIEGLNKFIDAQIYFNLGFYFDSSNRIEESIYYYKKSISLKDSVHVKKNIDRLLSIRESAINNRLDNEIVKNLGENNCPSTVAHNGILKISPVCSDLQVYDNWNSFCSEFTKKFSILSKFNDDENLCVVIIPAYNADSTLRASVESVLKQSYGNVLIYIINDCSTDATLYQANLLSSEYINVKVIDNKTNIGTYESINRALYATRKITYGYFAIHGSDDLMFPEKLRKQIQFIETESLMACIAGYARVDIKNKQTIKRGIGHSMAVYKKEVFNRIGYYDNVRFGADSEYFHRMISYFGDKSQKKINDLLTIAFVSDSNITSSNPDDSNKRLEYVSKFQECHNSFATNKNGLYVDKFVAYDDELMIICGMATVEERLDSLKETVSSIIDQVDKLIIYQNGYYSNLFPEDRKIKIISSLHTGIDQGDAGKFYELSKYRNCYYFSIDDDLIYPEDYVSILLRHLIKYKNKAVVTCHGKVFSEDAKSYFKDIKHNYRCLDNVNSESFVQFGGTGVMAFKTSLLDIKFEDFKYPNMADVWVGLYAMQHKVPVLVIPHEEGWIKYNDKIDNETTIYSKKKKDPTLENKLLSTCNNLRSVNKIMKVAFLTCTYGRTGISKVFKNNLIGLQNEFSNVVFTNIVVDSSFSNRNLFEFDANFKYINYQNSPLSNKWNRGLYELKKHDFDYLVIVGSDDVIDKNLFAIYQEQMNNESDFIGILDYYTYDINSDKCFYWPGYPDNHKRKGETIGTGRCFSRRIIESMNYQLWDNGLEKGLDLSMMNKFKNACVNITDFKKYTFKVRGKGIVLDIKGQHSVSKIEDFISTGMQEINDVNIVNYIKSLL